MRQKMGPLHWIGFIVILIWCLLPVAWIISLSFKSTTIPRPAVVRKRHQQGTVKQYGRIVRLVR